MDLIKLTSSTANPSELTQGEQVNGWDKLLWVERYQKAGEFKIEAKLSSGLREFLPLGSFLTHLKTREVMIVENKEIEQPKAEDPTIIITGRSMASYLENRIIGENLAAVSNELQEYILSAIPSWEQALYLITDNLTDATSADNQLPGWEAQELCSGSPATETRLMKYGTVYERILGLLKIDDIGLRTQRPLPGNSTSYFVIYQGVDRSNTVRFSWINGDVENLKYFFSQKKLKTQARVIGKWLQVRVNLTATKYARRVMLVDASDLDNQLNALPTGTPLTDLVTAYTIRGNEALAAQNLVSITDAEVSATAPWEYRTHYTLGDLVTVDGDFGASAVMRVTEYAEIEDENGTSGHPTLAIPGED